MAGGGLLFENTLYPLLGILSEKGSFQGRDHPTHHPTLKSTLVLLNFCPLFAEDHTHTTPFCKQNNLSDSQLGNDYSLIVHLRFYIRVM